MDVWRTIDRFLQSEPVDFTRALDVVKNVHQITLVEEMVGEINKQYNLGLIDVFAKRSELAEQVKLHRDFADYMSNIDRSGFIAQMYAILVDQRRCVLFPVNDKVNEIPLNRINGKYKLDETDFTYKFAVPFLNWVSSVFKTNYSTDNKSSMTMILTLQNAWKNNSKLLRLLAPHITLEIDKFERILVHFEPGLKDALQPFIKRMDELLELLSTAQTIEDALDDKKQEPTPFAPRFPVPDPFR